MTRALRFLFLVLLPLLVIWGCWMILKTPALRPVVISVYEPAMIQADETIHDMGKIKTDDKASYTFYLYNLGGKRLNIQRVETSCGCTAAEVNPKSLGPGEVAALDVVLNTSLKLGAVKKRITVFSDDPKTPRLNLYLTATVLPQMKGHANIAVKDPLVLFHGECATCHVQKGKGKSGKALFQADCGMCHGLNAEGGVAPGLLKVSFEDKDVAAHARRVIAQGALHNPEMPPFSKAKGGPLSDADIDSLMTFLAFQAEQSKAGLLDVSGNPKEVEAE